MSSSLVSPPPALPPKKRQSAPSPTRVAVVAPMSRGSSLPCSVHRQVSVSHFILFLFIRTSCRGKSFYLCHNRTLSKSSSRGVSPVGANHMEATLPACLPAAAWENSASLTNSFPLWSRTVVSVHETPAVKH